MVYVLPAVSLPDRSCMGPDPVVWRPDTRSALAPANASLVSASVAPSAELPLLANQPVVPASNPPLVISSSSAADAGLAIASPATSSKPAAAIAANRCRARLSTFISKRYPPCSAVSCSPRPGFLCRARSGFLWSDGPRSSASCRDRHSGRVTRRQTRPRATQLDQPQARAEYGASSDTDTGSPSTVAVTSADAVPSGSDVSRVVKACVVDLPAASAATDFDP